MALIFSWFCSAHVNSTIGLVTGRKSPRLGVWPTYILRGDHMWVAADPGAARGCAPPENLRLPFLGWKFKNIYGKIFSKVAFSRVSWGVVRALKIHQITPFLKISCCRKCPFASEMALFRFQWPFLVAPLPKKILYPPLALHHRTHDGWLITVKRNTLQYESY